MPVRGSRIDWSRCIGPWRSRAATGRWQTSCRRGARSCPNPSCKGCDSRTPGSSPTAPATWLTGSLVTDQSRDIRHTRAGRGRPRPRSTTGTRCRSALKGADVIAGALMARHAGEVHRHQGNRGSGIDGGAASLEMEVAAGGVHELGVAAEEIMVLERARAQVGIVAGAAVAEADVVSHDGIGAKANPDAGEAKSSRAVVVDRVVVNVGIGYRVIELDAGAAVSVNDVVIYESPVRQVVGDDAGNAVIMASRVADDIVSGAGVLDLDSVVAIVVKIAAVDQVVGGGDIEPVARQ